jgi:CHASE2 domain
MSKQSKETLVHKVRDAFIATFALASVLVCLEHFHIFDWADAVTLEIAGASTSEQEDFEKLKTRVEKSRVNLIAIDDATFTSAFNQTSPLNRDRLNQLIVAVSKTQPKIIVIDVDIAPASGELAEGERWVGARSLDKTLVRLAKEAGIPIVIPIPSVALNMFNPTHKWMQFLCKEGIYFASPKLIEHFGAVSKMPLEAATLGRVASRLDNGLKDNRVCEAVNSSPSASVFFAETEIQFQTRGQKSVPLNIHMLSARYLEQVTSRVVYKNSEFALSPEPTAGRIALIGGTYGNVDLQGTPKGAVFGVGVHAASIETFNNPVGKVHQIQSFLVDLIIGTFLGLAFGWSWKILDASDQKFGDIVNKSFDLDKQLKKHLALYFATRVMGLLLLITVVAVPFVLTFVTLVILKNLLSLGIWTNPAPLIFGLFIHSIVERIETLRHKSPTLGTKPPLATHLAQNNALTCWLKSKADYLLIIAISASVFFYFDFGSH